MNKSFYEQETWLVELPSVLFICLNRYKFVKATQSSSKIMEPFEFYPNIYLDRYLFKNRQIVKEKRKELKILNEQLNALQLKLMSIKEYKYDNSSPTAYPLDDVLRCVYHFASTDHSLNDVFNQIKGSALSQNNETPSSSSSSNEHSLNIVKNCLTNWINELEAKINSLQLQISQIKSKIENLYEENDLKKVKYNLHSVCIHEGSASLGHFWTYIWNNQQNKWYKYNDTEVSESTWEDLYANAVGRSNSNTSDNNKSSDSTPSAYFLIYSKAEDVDLYRENDLLMGNDLQRMLDGDKELLDNQLYSLKLKRILKETNEEIKKSNQLISASIESNLF
jgi:hypothetical protein